MMGGAYGDGWIEGCVMGIGSGIDTGAAGATDGV
jgi:hypothetical protein